MQRLGAVVGTVEPIPAVRNQRREPAAGPALGLLTTSVLLVLASLMQALMYGDDLTVPHHPSLCLDANFPAALQESNWLLHTADKTVHLHLRHLIRTLPWVLNAALPAGLCAFPCSFTAKPDSTGIELPSGCPPSAPAMSWQPA